MAKKLDIVDQQRIHRTVETLELVDGIELQRLDHVGHETLGMQVDHLGIGILLQEVVTHRVHQVRLAQADPAVQKQRVVAVLGIVGHLPGGRPRELVGLALDEVLEGEGAIKVAGVLERTFHLDVALDHPAGAGGGATIGASTAGAASHRWPAQEPQQPPAAAQWQLGEHCGEHRSATTRRATGHSHAHRAARSDDPGTFH